MSLDGISEVPIDVFKPLIQASVKLLSGESDLSSYDSLITALEPLTEKFRIPTKTLAGIVLGFNVMFQGIRPH
jgi:hypothetical protein